MEREDHIGVFTGRRRHHRRQYRWRSIVARYGCGLDNDRRPTCMGSTKYAQYLLQRKYINSRDGIVAITFVEQDTWRYHHLVSAIETASCRERGCQNE